MCKLSKLVKVILMITFSVFVFDAFELSHAQANSDGFRYPIENVWSPPNITQGFGHGSDGDYGHLGEDYGYRNEPNVVAAYKGVVVYRVDESHHSDQYKSWGNTLVIKHDDPSFPGGVIYTQYSHMKNGSLKRIEWDTVYTGEVIGIVGSTGRSTGSHLHFEVKTSNRLGYGYTGANFTDDVTAYGGITYYRPSKFISDHSSLSQSEQQVYENGSVSGSIDSPGRELSYKFVPQNTASYRIYTEGATDTYGYLLDGSKNVIDQNDDTVGMNFQIIRDLQAGQTYYIKVRHYSSSRTGDFVLRIVTNINNSPQTGSLRIPGPNSIMVFEHSDFEGNWYNLDVGEYPTWESTGLPNDCISSIRVGSNVMATLYEHTYFSGRSEVFVSSDDNLTNNSIGNDSVSSIKVQLKNTGSNNTPHGSAPGVPSGLRIASVGTNYIELRWDGVPNAENYQVVCCGSRDGSYWGAGASDGTSIRINGLSPGLTYWFKVRAHNQAGDSSYTSPVNAVTNR